MRVSLATDTGHGRPNEDFVGAVPGAVVVLDGVGIPDTADACRHGVAWYAHVLGGTVLGLLSRHRERRPAEALAEAIEVVAARHRGTCDVAHPASPQATVAIARLDDDRVDYLVLADAFVVLDRRDTGPDVVADPRDVTAQRECAAVLDGLTVGTPQHERALAAARADLRARKNRPGGYWIAKDDPRAAAEAVTGSVPLHRLRGVALLSNGAARVVSPYRLATWPDLLDGLRRSGPDAVIERVRRAEADDPTLGSDDAAIAYWALSNDRPRTA